jgi:hypothetical protein
MPTVVGDPADLPRGSHSAGFYAGAAEAAEQAGRFIAGAPAEQAVRFWVLDARTAQNYNRRLAHVAPAHVGCVAALEKEQVQLASGRLRPVPEVRRFVGDHPEGVTAAGDTMSHYLTNENFPAHLEYEAWFQSVSHENSRFLCPYALWRVPAENAPEVMEELARDHTHLVLSSSSVPAVRLLQLFLFRNSSEVPPHVPADLRWARNQGWVYLAGSSRSLELTPAGREVIREWSERTRVVE